jgi:hypothetical protein
MRNLTVKTVVLGALSLVLLAAAPASAEPRSMRFDIPFAFLAGDEVLPPGSYLVQVSGGFNLRVLSDADTKVRYVPLSYQAISRKLADSEPGVLRFEKLGDRYILRAVFSSSKSDGYPVKKSKTEMEWVRLHPGIVATTVEARAK